MEKEGTNGSELHRLTQFKEFDEKQFNRMFNVARPIIRRLAYGINTKKYGVSRDIIESYFWDKMMYVYNKYQDQYDEERLKYTIIHSLSLFKNKLLRSAYTQQADFNSDITSFEDIIEKGFDTEDDNSDKEYMDHIAHKLHKYMREHLTADEYLLFVTQLNPPKYILERSSSPNRISIYAIIEFFDLPKNSRSREIVSHMRKNINLALAMASEELSR